MLRLRPGEGSIKSTRSFKASEGGGEYNAARGLRRCFGLRDPGRKDPFFLEKKDVAWVFAGQEIAAHSVGHPNLWTLSDDLVCYELTGYPVTGLAFPSGCDGGILRNVKALLQERAGGTGPLRPSSRASPERQSA